MKYADKKSLIPDYLLQEIKKRQIRDKENTERKYFKSKEFDLYDFKIFNNKKEEYKNTVNYFTRVPNSFIQTNLRKEYGVNRILLVVFCEIDRNRSYEDTSYICINEIFKKCDYKVVTTKPKIFYEILNLNYSSSSYSRCLAPLSYGIFYNFMISLIK